MKRLAQALALGCLWALALAPSSQAAYGIDNFALGPEGENGSPAIQAGSHPFAVTTSFDVSSTGVPPFPGGWLRDFITDTPPGLVGDTTAYQLCTTAQFLKTEGTQPACPTATQVGAAGVGLKPNPESTQVLWEAAPIFNITPPPGTLLRLGFRVLTQNVFIDFTLNPNPPYNPIAAARNTPQVFEVFGAKIQLWGDPSSPAHDEQRPCGAPLNSTSAASAAEFEFIPTGKSCPVQANPKPFLTLPTQCSEPLESSFRSLSWEGEEVFGDVLSPPLSGCGLLNFKPSIAATPTTKAATSPTGLDFSLSVHDEGLTSTQEGATAQSEIEKAVVTLPEGMSVNPSQAEGLEVCTEAQLEAETLQAEPGEGCPQASKIGSLEVESPLVEEGLQGSLYVAKPYENLAGDSLLAVYAVFKNQKLGIDIKQTLLVEPDPVTGQLTTVAEDIPQLPFSHFKLHFREGTRSPLVSPPSCGSHMVKAMLYPWSGGASVESTSAFEVISGPDNSPCPKGGLPPFHPHLEAGTVNNAAGRFSPFNVKLTRTDSEQEFTNFSIKLPPGIAGKLAGIPFCSDTAIAAATARTGPHGGQEELDSPSCPAASQVGRTLAGSGVGPSLAYAPGKLYLAGPYHGSPISFVSITSGVVGPFDIGAVVVRLAIKVNPETGEVFLDSTGSDPIPHIIKGIPIHLRDIRAYTDRPEFTFNPTSCARKSTAATVLGSGLNFASGADDNPFVSTSPFQAADCAALPFEPKLSLKLIGGTKRGAFPKLKAFLRMRGFGEAGVARARVTLPRSEFIANAHFNTICTRVQFKAAGGNGEACPAGSVYGWAKAKTPILAEPLEGPIFLRSSEHELPDVVASLRGQEINVHLVGHVDSVKGQLRNTFETVPDAPVQWASFSFAGQKKGLFENSTNLCAATHRAKVEFTGQNGKRSNYAAPLKVKCKKAGAKHKRAAHTRRAAR